jgi:hypothetical protein
MNTTTESPAVDDWEANGPPWLRTGSFRRDGQPDRGPWLANLSWFSMTCSVIARCCLLAGVFPWLLMPVEFLLRRMHFWGNAGREAILILGYIAALGLPAMIFFALLGLPLGCLAWFVARRDRGEMERGERDPAGLSETVGIQRRARQASLFHALCLCLAPVYLLLLVGLLFRELF